MNVIVNYPDINNMKQLQVNLAKFQTILMKESIDRLQIDSNSKKTVLEEIIKQYK